ncbi:MAG: 50S ribosomal protein L4 [Crocinitomicaceae bacterium]|jgi:large subunit ribosomal protein L4|nr:50S ribosomal protein L4 [Flammeovirgaceae bacterium]|tara:strand:- start:54240 stop:54866 length:627 start_codon:yes stop_codon:yes gene_type:complete
MKIEVINSKGEDTGRKVELKNEIYEIEPNEHAVYLEVKQYLANQRQGTHKTKGKAEVTGSTRKLKKQKGTGTARAGSVKSPLLRGGGTMFGPVPRDYGFDLNKKVKKLAKRSALSSKASEKRIRVMEDQAIDVPKTKFFKSILESLKLDVDKALFITGERNDNVVVSARNIPNAKVISANELSTYELVNADYIVLFESAIETIENRLN